jgi:hypothetical protein
VFNIACTKHSQQFTLISPTYKITPYLLHLVSIYTLQKGLNMGKPMGRHPHTHYISPKPKSTLKRGRDPAISASTCTHPSTNLLKSQNRSNLTKDLQNLVKGQQTYLRKHRQKNLSSLEFRPSFLHVPSKIWLKYPLVTSVTYRYSICSSVIVNERALSLICTLQISSLEASSRSLYPFIGHLTYF